MIYKNVELYNIENIIYCKEKNALKLSRIPEEVRLNLNETAQDTAFNGCGCEIRFNMVSDVVKIILKRPSAPKIASIGVAEVYYGPFQGPYWVCPAFIGPEPTEIVIKKPENVESLKNIAKKNSLQFDPQLIRILLPYDFHNYLLSIQGETTLPRAEQSPNIKYLAYGSSITHGGSAIRPTGSYTMRLAQKLGVDLINLGFAGSAHFEEAMADYISARQDWNFATIELGINVIRFWEAETFEKKIDYFISKIAKSNTDKWILCTDMFTFEMDYTNNPKAQLFRNIVKSKIQSLNLPKLIYIPGTELLTQVTGLSADMVHPSESGFEEIATNFSKIIKEKLPKYL